MNAPSTIISSKTNWEEVQLKTDEEIDFSDSPELTGDWMASAHVELPSVVTLEVEPDVLKWFRAQGEQANNKMRAALRIYAQAHQ